MACCTGHRKNVFFEKISLAPKLCEMYATILLKLFLNFYQHKNYRSKCNCRIHIVVSEIVANLNISRTSMLYGTSKSCCTARSENDQLFDKPVAYPDIECIKK